MAEPFARGERVRINEGVFRNFTGVVTEVKAEQRTLSVALTLFGRKLTIDLPFGQVRRAALGFS